MTSSDEIIESLGGCGLYQVRLSVLIHVLKILICWSDVTCIIIFTTPDFWCVDDVTSGNMSEVWTQNTANEMTRSCVNMNGSKCSQFRFDPSMDTLVNKFDLVCDKAFIPSLIVSIQGAGMLIGNPISGQMADLFGRRIPFFIGLFLMTVFNLVSAFSLNWAMFAVARFFVGIGAGFFYVVHCSLFSEFSPARWRAWIFGFPSWAIHTSLFVLVAWLAHSWNYIHFAVVIVGIGCMLSMLIFLPESFRWLLVQNKYEQAQKTLATVAKVNKKPLPDLDPLFSDQSVIDDKKTNYTFIHLFKTPYLVRVTLLLALAWVGNGFVRQALNFGIQALSGNVYINMLLFSASEIPGKAAASALQGRFGRRSVTRACYIVTTVSGLVAGILQYIDTPFRGSLTNGFAICANMGINAAWGPVEAMTAELYPTVIRNLGSGSLSTLARIGVIAGTQLVFLNIYVPGLLYFVCGLFSMTCAIAVSFLPETMNAGMADRIETEVPVKIEWDDTQNID